MKTKNILMVAAVAAFLSTAQVMAQNTTTRQNRADVNELLDKRCNRMKSQLKLDDATAAKFAPLYKEYLKEMRACHPTRTNNCNKGQCTDAERKACIEKGMDCREQMVKTQKKYYAKFEKFLNAEQLQTLFCARGHAGHKYDRAGRRHHRGHNCDTNRQNCDTNRQNCDANGQNCDVNGHKAHHNCN